MSKTLLLFVVLVIVALVLGIMAVRSYLAERRAAARAVPPGQRPPNSPWGY